MIRVKEIDRSPRLLPVFLDEQLIPGTLPHAIDEMVDLLDLSCFEVHYRNEKRGARAYPPSVLLKIILLAYSHGIISSRRIERVCVQNVVFRAMTGDMAPDFTTIAAFVSRSHAQIANVFTQVVSLLAAEGLIGQKMFAIDGLKLPSNASKHVSGTREELRDQTLRLRSVIERMVEAHRTQDGGQEAPVVPDRDARRLARYRRELERRETWLEENTEDRRGPSGKVRKSNLTDNESAKIATDKGVIQGYCGVAAVDDKHQVIVAASAHGTGSEQELLIPVVDACASVRASDTVVTADAGYYSEDNLELLKTRGIEALIPDNKVRVRDERIGDRSHHLDTKRAMHLQTRQGKQLKRRGLFQVSDFRMAEDYSHAVCPAGKRLYRSGTFNRNGYHERKFNGTKRDCSVCPMREKCLRHPERTTVRQVSFMTPLEPRAHREGMRAKLATPEGRALYDLRMGTVEPVFGNMRYNKGMNRFTLRGCEKVDGQWKLFALVHDIEKWCHYRPARNGKQ
jgi:transposase